MTKEGIVRAAGWQIRRGFVGQGDQPCLMLHCSLARHDALLPLANRLPDIRAILPDHLGHGGSDDWADEGDYYTACTAVAAELAEPGSHVIGHSFGGTVALRLAVERPDLVSRLTLIEPVFFAAARGAPEYAEHTAYHDNIDAMIAAGDREAAAAAFHARWGTGRWESLSERSREYIAARIHLIGASAVALVDDRAGMLAQLSRVKVPVSLIAGGNSPAIIGAINRRLAQAMPQARSALIPGAGHMLPITHTTAVAAAIMQG